MSHTDLRMTHNDSTMDRKIGECDAIFGHGLSRGQSIKKFGFASSIF